MAPPPPPPPSSVIRTCPLIDIQQVLPLIAHVLASIFGISHILQVRSDDDRYLYRYRYRYCSRYCYRYRYHRYRYRYH